MAAFDYFPAHFTDPATGLRPSSERECIALIALFHGRGAVRWDSVAIHDTSLEPTPRTAASLFPAKGVMCAEYPLFSHDEAQVNVWGDMRADLAYLSENGLVLTLVECKLRGRFTSGGTNPETGQLGRQAEFLRQSKYASPHLVLLCHRDGARSIGYADALRMAIAHRERNARVVGNVMFLEDVANAIARVAV